MRTTRIYQEGHYHIGDEVILSESASHHIHTVLRMQEGQTLYLFDGKKNEFYATIITSHKKKSIVRIEKKDWINNSSPLHIHLGQGLAKGDKMEWIIQKATELGVNEITPIFTLRSNVKYDENKISKKMAQWQSIIIHACEQSGRTELPLLHPPCHLTAFIQKNPQTTYLMLDPYSSQTLKHTLPETNQVTLLIGPEGGFSPCEQEEAEKYKLHRLSLGPRILRTETAAIATLSILQALRGDL